MAEFALSMHMVERACARAAENEDKPAPQGKSAAALQARVTASHEWLQKTCDDAKADVRKWYEAASHNVTDDGVPDETRATLRDAVTNSVQAWRVAAYERGAADVADELASAFADAADLELAQGVRPEPEQVARFVDDAVGIACELTNEAAADGDAEEARAMLAAQGWRGERVVVSEVVTAYERSRRAAYADLGKRDTKTMGFEVCTDEDEIPEDKRAAEPAPTVVLLGLRWSALFDKRTCTRCKDLDGRMTIVALPFNGPPLHANCRCVTSLWPLVWNWVEEIAS